MTKNNRSRRFGFVGFKTEEQARAALNYFNTTYLHTSKLDIDFAKTQDDDTLPRPWSKYSQGSSAFDRMNPRQKKLASKRAEVAQIEAKKNRFREFLQLSTGAQKQSWKD